jgi:hypothetical protein
VAQIRSDLALSGQVPRWILLVCRPRAAAAVVEHFRRRPHLTSLAFTSSPQAQDREKNGYPDTFMKKDSEVGFQKAACGNNLKLDDVGTGPARIVRADTSAKTHFSFKMYGWTVTHKASSIRLFPNGAALPILVRRSAG